MVKAKKRQNIDVTELSPNKRFPKHVLKGCLRQELQWKNTGPDLYMLRDVRRYIESKDLDSNLLTLKHPFPYIAELSSSQGIGALSGY